MHLDRLPPLPMFCTKPGARAKQNLGEPSLSLCAGPSLHQMHPPPSNFSLFLSGFRR
uniref:Uncharacterized protein n=1 Tax=Triticum urartu TaxID=4572 RepID=A0A8R7UUR0_TRIUA